MAPTWNSTIDLTVSFTALAPSGVSFQTVLLVDTITNSSLAGFGGTVAVGSNGSLYLPALGTISEAVAANTDTAGSVGTALLNELPGAFSHDFGVEQVALLSIHGDDDPATIFATLEDLEPQDYYKVVVIDRDIADICDHAAGVVASGGRPRLVFGALAAAAAYGDSSTWAAAFVDGASAALPETTQDRLILTYHNDGTQPVPSAVAIRGTATGPDDGSAPWIFPVPAINKVTKPSAVTSSTFKTNLEANNINVPLPFYSSDVWFEPGVTSSGKPIYLIVTTDWFKARLETRLQEYKFRTNSLDSKIPLTRAGQGNILQIIESLYTEGVTLGHFLSREEAAIQGKTVEIRALPITDEDRAAQRLRFRVEIPIVINGRIVTINVNIVQ
jgi:hypothetical protein